MVGRPTLLQRFRNESSFARSDAEQRPDHAGRQYVILARIVAILSRKFSANRLFSGINVSQGSVAIYARYAGIFNNHFTANLPRNLRYR